MRLADAEKAIVHEWRRWRLQNGKPESWGNRHDAVTFYGYVSEHRPELLKFRCAGSKLERVHAWLLSSGSVQD